MDGGTIYSFRYILFHFNVLFDFINLTQTIISRLVHKIFYLQSTFVIYRKFYRNFASTNEIMKRFALCYFTVKWLWYIVCNQYVVSLSPRLFLFIVFLFCIFTIIRFV